MDDNKRLAELQARMDVGDWVNAYVGNVHIFGKDKRYIVLLDSDYDNRIEQFYCDEKMGWISRPAMGWDDLC